jgi:predicted dehydrogenase
MVSAKQTIAITRPASNIRVGIIGTGFGASVHLPAMDRVPGAEVVSICSRRPDRAHMIAARHGIKKATGDYRDLVRDPDVDAVIIASPPNLHHTMAFAALEAGKHVLCEKPMSRTLAEARDLVKLAEQAQVIAMVNHEFRFDPVRAHAKQLIDRGYLGDLHSASVTVYRSTLNDPHGIAWDWLMDESKGGGMLGAAGSHYLDALRWWFGEIKAVSGITATMVRERRLPDSNSMGPVSAEDNFAVLLRFVNGAIGTVTYSATAAFEAGEQILLSGSEGMLLMAGDGKLFGAKRMIPLDEVPVPLPLTVGEALAGDHPLMGPTTLLLQEWIGAIKSGRVASPSFYDGLKVQELMDGTIRSSQLGRWVEVERGRFHSF